MTKIHKDIFTEEQVEAICSGSVGEYTVTDLVLTVNGVVVTGLGPEDLVSWEDGEDE